ncbi:hypothetical protein V1477_017506 [Vespula maculifrons]|uniref:Uncharacterized protein n=1 Tax=Vespula maculifrons TaxID=7453 RepID=A0ABD2B681_VESMC
MSKSCDTNSDYRIVIDITPTRYLYLIRYTDCMKEKGLPDVTATTMTDRPPFATHRHFLLIDFFLYMYSNDEFLNYM